MLWVILQKAKTCCVEKQQTVEAWVKIPTLALISQDIGLSFAYISAGDLFSKCSLGTNSTVNLPARWLWRIYGTLLWDVWLYCSLVVRLISYWKNGGQSTWKCCGQFCKDTSGWLTGFGPSVLVVFLCLPFLHILFCAIKWFPIQIKERRRNGGTGSLIQPPLFSHNSAAVADSYLNAMWII